MKNRYAYSVTFTALIVGAANLADYWEIPSSWKSIIYVLVPIMLWIINAFRVEVTNFIPSYSMVRELIYLLF